MQEEFYKIFIAWEGGKNWIPDPQTNGAPLAQLIWRPFMDRPVHRVNVVMVAKDPGLKQYSCGLAFSYPSLNYSSPRKRHVAVKTLIDAVLPERERPTNGSSNSLWCDLSPWSRNGVILMNANLTKGQGDDGEACESKWKPVTDALIKAIVENNDGVVFMLFGEYAQQKRTAIEESCKMKGKQLYTKDDVEDIKKSQLDSKKSGHLVLEIVHPCSTKYTMEETKKMIGEGFSLANKYEEAIGRTPVSWSLPTVPNDAHLRRDQDEDVYDEAEDDGTK